ncbi:hypothetical protein Q3G72_013000 [Acer saccharum]|nr:hypothetical protein Q3G72_013000 [Acer saccharum]
MHTDQDLLPILFLTNYNSTVTVFFFFLFPHHHPIPLSFLKSKQRALPLLVPTCRKRPVSYPDSRGAKSQERRQPQNPLGHVPQLLLLCQANDSLFCGGPTAAEAFSVGVEFPGGGCGVVEYGLCLIVYR